MWLKKHQFWLILIFVVLLLLAFAAWLMILDARPLEPHILPLY